MRIVFEELGEARRAGGIEAATCGLAAALERIGMVVTRSFPESPAAEGRLPDCVHVHGIWSPALMGRFLAWSGRGVPCVLTTHGMLEPWSLSHKRMKKWLALRIYQKRHLNRADALHATSTREADNLRKLGLKPRIETIPWGIDVIRQKAENAGDVPGRPEAEARETLTALFVGRIYPVKGLPMLVEAWAEVRPAGWRMKIVGPDEAGHRAEVESLVAKAGLAESFHFVGPLNGKALERAYRDADLLVAPSHTENFGMSIAEALAHGVPVITTCGTPWEGVLDRGCGWWTEISAAGLAAALRDATSRGEASLREMGERGREWMRCDFSWDAVANGFAKLYRTAGKG